MLYCSSLKVSVPKWFAHRNTRHKYNIAHIVGNLQPLSPFGAKLKTRRSTTGSHTKPLNGLFLHLKDQHKGKACMFVKKRVKSGIDIWPIYNCHFCLLSSALYLYLQTNCIHLKVIIRQKRLKCKTNWWHIRHSLGQVPTFYSSEVKRTFVLDGGSSQTT